MTVPIFAILRLTLFYTAPGASIANSVFNYRLDAAAAEEDDLLDAVTDWINNFWGDLWAEVAPVTATLASFALDQVTVTGTVVANIGVGDIDIVGVSGGEVAPAGVSAYLLAQTALPKQRGSKYVPFISEARIDEGLLDATAVTQLTLLLLSYLASITVIGGGQMKPGVASRGLVEFVAFLAQGLVNDVPAYQRRRKPFVGS